MKWNKQGLIFCPDGDSDWMCSHAQIPTPLLLDDDTVRVFFATRDPEGRSRTASVDLDAGDLSRVKQVSRQPVIDLGPPGTHDDSGAMPFSVVPLDQGYRFFYTGWNQPRTVSYLLSVGICEGDGNCFNKPFGGPVLSRDIHEPYWAAAPCVIREGDSWRMWYISCYDWVEVDGRLEPVYCVKHASSDNGIDWQTNDHICIETRDRQEAIGRPWVVRDQDCYRMWFSYRGSLGYRERGGQHYRIGYAESPDGLNWTRMDEQAGIDPSADGWDADMVEYCSILDLHGERIMFYNGNGFGRSGFGWAVQEAA